MLKQKLDELFQAMAGGDGQPPVPGSIVIAELDPQQFDTRGYPVITATDLQTPEEYETRFAELLTKQLPWLNLSYYGLIDGKGLVIVELPNQQAQPPSRHTSVNFSGPPSAVAASGWDARAHVVLR